MVLKLKRKVPTANGRLALTSLSSIFPIIIHARATPIKITGIILLESDDKMLSGFDKIAIPNAANIKNNFSLYPYIFRSIAQTLRADTIKVITLKFNKNILIYNNCKLLYIILMISAYDFKLLYIFTLVF